MSQQKTQNVEMDSALNAFCDGMSLPTTGNPLPGQEFIDKFGIELGTQYFARGLSLADAAGEYCQHLQSEVDRLQAKLDAAGLS